MLLIFWWLSKFLRLNKFYSILHVKNNGSSKKKYHLAFSALSRLPWIKIFLQQKLLTKYYLWASFEGIWSMSKLSKLDIQMAISAIKIKLRKKFFCRNVYHDVVAHVPNFQLSARSSSFFSAVFPSLSWTLFFGWPVICRGLSPNAT